MMSDLDSLLLALLLAGTATAYAQDKGTLNPVPLPPLANPTDPAVAAKELFGRKSEPVPQAARAIGFYARGCLAGAIALPINGPTWQVMRLSRNRNWGHPSLIRFLERFCRQGAKSRRLARTTGRRSGAAARRAHADRPYQPSGRARCRHLAHANADARTDAGGARGDVGHQCGRRRLARCRPRHMDLAASRA